LHDERSHDADRAVARFGESADRFAGSIDPDFAGVRAVKIDLGHVRIS